MQLQISGEDYIHASMSQREFTEKISPTVECTTATLGPEYGNIHSVLGQGRNWTGIQNKPPTVPEISTELSKNVEISWHQLGKPWSTVRNE